MIKAYDYLGFIDLDAEHDDENIPHTSCPICVDATLPADSELIYEELCVNCAQIIHAVYTCPHHPVSQSAYIPVADDSAQVLGLIKMRLYNMIESSTNTKHIEPIKIIKDLMEQTPAKFAILSLINAFLVTLLSEERFSVHSMRFMVNTAVAYNYISVETCEGFKLRIDDLDSNRGSVRND